MTTEQHPITPPPDLRRLWAQQAQRMDPWDSIAWLEHVGTQASRWGADQELEACVKWIEDCGYHPSVPEDLRSARRPKPPSLAEQALAALNEIEDRYAGPSTEEILVRRALERLQKLEQQENNDN